LSSNPNRTGCFAVAAAAAGDDVKLIERCGREIAVHYRGTRARRDVDDDVTDDVSDDVAVVTGLLPQPQPLPHPHSICVRH